MSATTAPAAAAVLEGGASTPPQPLALAAVAPAPTIPGHGYPIPGHFQGAQAVPCKTAQKAGDINCGLEQVQHEHTAVGAHHQLALGS